VTADPNAPTVIFTGPLTANIGDVFDLVAEISGLQDDWCVFFQTTPSLDTFLTAPDGGNGGPLRARAPRRRQVHLEF